MTGSVFNIQKFSLHDGPGLRTTVFLKGCPLRCPWCANPESQRAEIMMMNGKPDARQMTVDEVVKTCLADRAFYEESGGGVTVSGGEPFAQGEFLAALLRALRAENIHTAIETTGCAESALFAETIRLADLILFDIKHHDGEVHRRAAGVDNALILENFGAALRNEASGGAAVLPRVPVIPGFNDSLEDAAGIAWLIRSCGGSRAQLLPFHQMGDRKYTLLNIPYALRGVKPLYPEDLTEYKAAFAAEGVEVFF